jgi:hypothetical protein
MQWVMAVGSGMHTVKIQYRVSESGDLFAIPDQTLTVLRTQGYST